MSIATPPLVTTESTRIIRDRHFSLAGGDDAILRALSHLHQEHVTGTLCIDLACGGVCTLRFREEQRIEFPADGHE